MGEGFRYISFLSDFGLEDEYVSVCKGVILRIAPEVRIIDITHQVPAQNIHKGSMILERAVTYIPVAVHLAVVDPGVGSARRALIAESAGGSAFVGPDNGLLGAALARLGGVRTCRAIENQNLMLSPRSHTFHGRDVFSPAAAYLAKGVPLEEFGPEIPPDSLVELETSNARQAGTQFHAEVVYIDHFGNLELNLKASDLMRIGGRLGSRMQLQLTGKYFEAPFASTFATVGEGELVLTEDSSGFLSISVSGGSAADILTPASLGSPVIIGLAEDPSESLD